MTNMQLIINSFAIGDLPPVFMPGSIERVSDEELIHDFFKTYNDLGFHRTIKRTRDNNTLVIFYDDWLGWRIIVCDVII